MGRGDRRTSEYGRAGDRRRVGVRGRGSGYFSTFLAVWNPNPPAATVRVYYRHENGSVYWQDVALPALGRAVLGTPSWMPAGGFGIEVLVLTGSGVVAERMIYGGPSWEIGHAGAGARTHIGTDDVRFAEGTSAGMFETYFLLTNLAAVPATVTLTYRTAAGGVIGADPTGDSGVWPRHGVGHWDDGRAGLHHGGDQHAGDPGRAGHVLADGGRAACWPATSA